MNTVAHAIAGKSFCARLRTLARSRAQSEANDIVTIAYPVWKACTVKVSRLPTRRQQPNKGVVLR